MKSQQCIGITGGIGSGKSTVCRILEIMGFPVYYSDDEAKRIMHEDSKLINSIKEAFGENAYQGGKLNRSSIAEVIFREPEKKNTLNALVHPKVRSDFAAWVKKQNKMLVFQESALLFETEGYKLLDKIILVTAPEVVRINRILQRDRLPIEAIKARINNQLPDSEKISLADFVIKNDDQQLVLPQVLKILEIISPESKVKSR